MAPAGRLARPGPAREPAPSIICCPRASRGCSTSLPFRMPRRTSLLPHFHHALLLPFQYSLPSVRVFEKLAHSEVSSGSQGPTSSSSSSRDVPSFRVADDAQKTVLVQAEVQRMKSHPPGSAYTASRLKVLDKMLHLLGKVRTSSEGEELELLFSNLNF